ARRFPELVRQHKIVQDAWMTAPLVANGVPFGALSVSFAQPHDFTEAERDYLTTLVHMCALALQRERNRHDCPELVDPASVLMRLGERPERPRGGWLLSRLSPAVHRRLVGAGYEIVDRPGGGTVVQPARAR